MVVCFGDQPSNTLSIPSSSMAKKKAHITADLLSGSALPPEAALTFHHLREARE
jgi:hypothetical protein